MPKFKLNESTKGIRCGCKHDIGQAAADESLNEIINYMQGSNMIFITAGMGGGTGTGASHVIARAAKELNILTVGVVTLPFSRGSEKNAKSYCRFRGTKKTFGYFNCCSKPKLI